MSELQAQCWICPQCYDDRHHEPGDMHCIQGQAREAKLIASINQKANKLLQQDIAQARQIITELVAFCEQPDIVAATDGAFDPDATIQAAKRFLSGGER